MWKGWGTALKPACEFITLCRKPISEPNVPLNVLKWGVGGLNIEGSRIETNGEIIPINRLEKWSGFGQIEEPEYEKTENSSGRYPSNLLLDEESASLLDEQTGKSNSIFFYCAKPSNREKDKGLLGRVPCVHWQEESIIHEENPLNSITHYTIKEDGTKKIVKCRRNIHPTVKPVDLLKYLVNLVTPLSEICLDPFVGSGTTMVACKELGVAGIGVDREEESITIAKWRVEDS
jgi:site-specific DNA-methyltransferase (adenine-specific)